MKTKLLTPPKNNGEIVLIPQLKNLLCLLGKNSIVGVVHQPYFFNPGVALKFAFLEQLSLPKKKIIFLDTDRIALNVRIPGAGGGKIFKLIESDNVLYDFITPNKAEINNFFNAVEAELVRSLPEVDGTFDNFSRYKDIVKKNLTYPYLKHVLAESFLQFFEIRHEYDFVSELCAESDFKNFMLKIFEKDELFRQVFNQALNDYRKIFRFRYRNFPFPRLEQDELPFWMIREGKRCRLYKDQLKGLDLEKIEIFPRAVTLTLFLRLYKLDFLIHGIGGGNYEWIQDRIIERFFERKPPAYIIASGTFFMNNFQSRDLPYFLFSPEQIKRKLQNFMQEVL